MKAGLRFFRRLSPPLTALGVSPVSIKKALIRLPRNLRSNRFYQIFGKAVFVSSPRHRDYFYRFAERQGTDLDRNRTRVFVRPSALLRNPVKIKKSRQGFVLPHLGRFGNAVREVVSAAATAQSLGLGHVVLQGFNLFTAGSELSNPGTHSTPSGLKVWIDSVPDRRSTGPVLLIDWKRGHFLIPELDSSRAWSDAKQFLFTPQTSTGLGEHTLVIHIRGGDVFGPRDTPAYGQPPLSYYLLILDHKAWQKVIVVHQDHHNPVLKHIILECIKRGLNHDLVSGSLRRDLDLLFRAQNLVAGRGTFSPAVAGLSRHATNVYFFEDKFIFTPKKVGIRLWRIEDHLGEYRRNILRDNWTNSRDQRDLMISYPVSSLRIAPPQDS